jgi:hypothetical protein
MKKVIYKWAFSVYNDSVRQPPQIMITLTPKYIKHSTHMGVQIYKRKSGTGTSGGMWLTDSTMFTSLARAKAHLEFYSDRLRFPLDR